MVAEHTKKRPIKIIVLGNSGVGKTSLISQFIQKRFASQYQPAVGADFLTKEVVIDGKAVILHVWDTAGWDHVRHLGTAFYRGADACVLVYDITKKESFDMLDVWRDELASQAGLRNIEVFPTVVLGNKADKKKERHVPEEKADKWFRSKYPNQPNQYFETSAKDGTRVEDAFTCITSMALKKRKMAELYEQKTVNFNSTTGEQAAAAPSCSIS